MIRKYIEKIGEKRNPQDMEKLGDMLAEIICDLKESHPQMYKKYKMELVGMAYNYEIDKELAEDIVKKMQPLGEYWNYDTVASVVGNDFHGVPNVYLVLNSLVNDYSNIIPTDDVDTYVNMAHAWLDDVDAPEHKTWWYFVK
jgi:hypothetical protein